jgi:hypothetical protein
MRYIGGKTRCSFVLKRLAHPTGFEPVASAFGGQEACFWPFQNLLGAASHRRETVTSERQLGN